MRRTVLWSGGLLVALAALGSCGKDKTTALDIKLEISGNLDQVRIDMVSVAGKPVLLTDEPTTLFPVAPKMLRTGDVLTLWFPDSDDMKTVVVSATGRLCGHDASPQAMTPGGKLSKGATVPTTLALANDGTVCAGTGTGGGGGTGGGAGGTGGAAGTGGSGGGSAAGGSGGKGGAGIGGGTGGIAGAIGSGGTAGGAAGRGGAGGSAGTTGAAGTGGAAGRGGTSGTAGAAGRGGAGGTAGAAGRGGTGGTGGAAGRGGNGGTTGSGGTGTACATTPTQALAQPGAMFSLTAGCGYAGAVQTVDNTLTPSDVFAFASAAAFGNSANCGRCVELVRSGAAGGTTRVTATLVGSCTDQLCTANPNQARFQLSAGAYQILATMNEPSLPLPGETLTYSFVPCPVPANQPILANVRIASGAATSVLFVQQRYGITAVTVEDPTTAQTSPMTRTNDASWLPPTGMTLSPSFRFHLTDVNNAAVTSATLSLQNITPFSSIGTQFPVCPSP